MKNQITGFITRTRRSKKGVLTISIITPNLMFNKLFGSLIESNDYKTISVEYTEKHIFLKFFKTNEGTYKIYFTKGKVMFLCNGLKKYFLQDIHNGGGISHYSLSYTEEKDMFALKCMINDFE
jgi:hypothetical protein